MVLEVVDGDTNDLYTPCSEVFGAAGNFTELCCANRGEIAGVREEDSLRKELRKEGPQVKGGI